MGAQMLQFGRVTDCTIRVAEEVEYYQLSRIAYSPQEHTVDIHTHYALTITLAVERLEAEFLPLNETRQDWK
jgi:hypothetical protein